MNRQVLAIAVSAIIGVWGLQRREDQTPDATAIKAGCPEGCNGLYPSEVQCKEPSYVGKWKNMAKFGYCFAGCCNITSVLSAEHFDSKVSGTDPSQFSQDLLEKACKNKEVYAKDIMCEDEELKKIIALKGVLPPVSS